MKNKKIIYILIIVLVIIIGGIIIWQRNEKKNDLGAVPTPPADETADWVAYKKEEYGFEIKHPGDFAKEEWTDFIFTNITDEVGGFFLTQFKIPSSYIKSKFYSSDIRIEIDDKSVCDRLNQFPDVDENLTNMGNLTINNINFLKKEKKAANPGVSYDKIIYYTKNKDRCYSITLFNIVLTTNIEALTDQNKIMEEQNQIKNEKKNFIEFLEKKMLPTFKFL